MKPNHQRTKRIARPTTLKPLFLFTLLGLNAAAYAAVSPFASVPLHLQTETSNTSSGGVKPNIVLQVDDSGSMQWSPYRNDYPKGSERSRMAIAKDAITKVVSNPEYTKKANMTILTLWNNEWPYTTKNKATHKLAEDMFNGSREFGMTEAELKDIAGKLTAGGGTPAVERYFDSAALLQKAIKYRCQKSYIILFSDGDAYSSFNQPTIDERNRTFTWSQYNKDQYDSGNHSFSLLAHRSPRTVYKFPDDMSRFLENTPAAHSMLGYRFPALFSYNSQTRTYTWNTKWNGIQNYFRDTIWPSHPDSLPFAAALVAQDLKTDNGTDAAGKSWDDTTDYNGVNFKTQNIMTYAVGFGSGLSTLGLRALDRMANANNYQSLNASTQEELDEAFAKIFTAINLQNELKPPYSTASITPTAIMSDTSADVLSGTAGVLLDLKNAASEIRVYSVNKSSGNVPVYTVDTNNYGTPDFSQRKVLFNEGGNNNKVSWLESFAGSNDKFGITNSKNANEWKDSLIPWLMRSKSDDQIAATANNSIQYRVRGINPDNNMDTRNMGHILNASLAAVGAEQYGRQRYLLTAANDGMVYFFESKNSTAHPYELKMNYMPAGMQREGASDTVMQYYKNIASKDYITNPSTNPHQYLLNGDFTVRITSSDTPNQRIFMSGNMGQAGRGSYSLNLAGKSVTGTAVGIDGGDWLTSVPLFETPKSANNKMGYTIGKPGIARVATTRTVNFTGTGTAAKATMTTDLANVYYATFVNSGIRHPSDQANTESALYVYSTLGKENVGKGSNKQSIPYATGDLVKKITANAIGGGLAEATLLDVNLDGVVDLAYAGDYKGNMYRFDLRDQDPNKWTSHRLFTTKANQPITSAPAVTYMDDNTYVVVFGTGSDVYQTDLSNTDQQSVYGIYDFIGNPTPQGTSGVGELLRQQIGGKNSNSTYETRELSKNQIDLNRHKGWYFDLAEPGERVTVRPTTMLKTVVLATRTYNVNTTSTNTGSSADVCEPKSSVQTTSATSWIMQFRGDTGGRLPSKGEENAAHFPYVNLTGETLTEAKFADRNENSLVSGFRNVGAGILSLLSLVGDDGSSSAVNHSGAIGHGVGYTDTQLIDNGTGHQFCYNANSEVSQMIVSDSSNLNGGASGTVQVFREICAGVSLRRISWREIF